MKVIKGTLKSDTVPEYLKDITFKEACAYYFNWHPSEPSVTLEIVSKWFLEKKGWVLQE